MAQATFIANEPRRARKRIGLFFLWSYLLVIIYTFWRPVDVGIVVNGDLYGPFLLERVWVVCWLLFFAAMLALRPDWRGEFVGQLRAARTIYRRS